MRDLVTRGGGKLHLATSQGAKLGTFYHLNFKRATTWYVVI